ncbi:ABC transporter permease [Paenibacillus sp. strain BS8-2]
MEKAEIAGKAGVLPQKKPGLLKKMYMQRNLLIMTVPFVVLAFVFSYLPLWGWVLAFMDYKVGHEIWSSAFIGFERFQRLLGDDQFYHVLWNTLAMGLLSLASGFVGAIGLALLLNEVRLKLFKRVVQTITYIPHFVSWVVIANIVISFLSPDGGVINELLMKMGLINESIYFMSKESWFWTINTIASLWKELGWSTIIYLAVLSSINPEQYEAADVDGASRYHKMWHISIPGIMPTAMLLLLLSIGWIIQGGFESQFLLGNPMVISKSEVLDLYALRYSTQIGDWSYGVAITMFRSIVSVLLVLMANYLAKLTTSSRLF